jgi:hypothetical protein
MVMPANVWDSLFGADLLQTDCREFGSSALDLTSTMKTSVGDAALDEVTEGTTTLRDVAQIVTGFCAGLTDGAGTSTIHYRNLANSKNRITASSVDEHGNRGSVTLDLD